MPGEMGLEGFQDSLERYILSIRESRSEASIRQRCLDFLRESLGISMEAGDELEHRVFRGRVDALLGRLVFEFKPMLEGETLSEAESQLKRYLTDLHHQDPTITYTGVASDGLRFLVYRATYAASSQASLETIGSLDLEKVLPSPLRGKGQDRGEKPLQEAYFWLDGLFSHFRAARATPTARSILVALGPNSPTFHQAFSELYGLFQRVQASPEVAVRYREWQSYLSIVYGSEVGDEALFIRHTYLSLVARLIARAFLGPGVMLTSPEALEKTVNGDYFREQGIANFIEDDFFTWPLTPDVAEEGLALVRRLANSLSAYDFSQAQQDLLKGLYEGLVDPETRHDLGEYYTPDWLAEYILDVELALSREPDRSVLDPACGSGTFLFTAIRLIKAARVVRGEDAFDALLHLQDQVMGMDVHPVAVTIARTNYLLALGELVQGPHPPVLLPVYLSNAIILPGTTESELMGGYPEPVHTIQTSEPGVVFELPHSVATNLEMLDWLFSRLPNYLAGAELRRRMQSEEEATREVLEAFHNYLLAYKPRTPIPEPLSEFAADTMVRTARTLIKLYLEGKDHVWLYILKNLPASIYLAQRKFDLVVGNPPWLSMRYIRNPQYRQQVRSLILRDYRLLSSQGTHLFTQMELATLFFARCADLYLKGGETPSVSPPYQGGDIGGVIAMVMPRAVLTADQHRNFTSFAFAVPPSQGGTTRGVVSGGGGQTGAPLELKLERVLDLEQVSPLFNVPACVLVAHKGQPSAYPVPGVAFRGDLPSRNTSWEEAQPKVARTDAAFDRQAGKLLPEGEALLQGPVSYYEDKFYNGATLYPRTLWFVRLRRGPLGYNPHRPPLETDPEATRLAKAPWKDIQMSGNVEAEFLYATLPSGDLVPFGYTRLRLVVLPLLREGDRLVLVNRDRALEQGYFGLAEWLNKAEKEWEDKASRDEQGRLRIPNVLGQIDYRRKLTRQKPTAAYKVLYNKSGTNLAATIIQDTGSRSSKDDTGLELSNGFVADHEAYIFETDSAGEAFYLAAVLNSPILDDLIKSSQTRGLFGARDIHTRPLQLPIPQYDPNNRAHRRLAKLGQECHQIVVEALPEISARYRSTGKIRGEVRRLLATQLAEIDGLVRRLLGVAGEAGG